MTPFHQRLRWGSFWLLLAIASSLVGCGRVIINPQADVEPTDTAAEQNASPTTASVRALLWTNLIDPQVLAEFTQQTKIQVEVEWIQSNEEIMEKLISNPIYDVALPAGYLVERLIQRNMLTPFAGLKLNNLYKPQPPYKGLSWDPGNHFSLPYLWITVGLIYDHEEVGHYVSDLKELLDPSWRKSTMQRNLQGEFALLNQERYAIATALIYLGFSPDTTAPAEIQKAIEVLKRFKKDLGIFVDPEQLEHLVNEGKMLLAQCSSAQASQIFDQHPNLRFILPKEGTFVATRNLVVPKTAPHPQEAAQLISFLLRPHIIARIVNYSRAGCVSQEALAFVKSNVKNGPSFWYPENNELAFMVKDLAPAVQSKANELWKELMP